MKTGSVATASRAAATIASTFACPTGCAVMPSRQAWRPKATPHDGSATALVPLASALGRNRDPARALHFAKDRQWIGYEMGHLDLLSRPEVYARLREWLA